MPDIEGDVLVIGGSLGEVAAAYRAGAMGVNVHLLAETEWLGGQMTSQGVSCPDERDGIEQGGCTDSYQTFRHPRARPLSGTGAFWGRSGAAALQPWQLLGQCSSGPGAADWASGPAGHARPILEHRGSSLGPRYPRWRWPGTRLPRLWLPTARGSRCGSPRRW